MKRVTLGVLFLAILATSAHAKPLTPMAEPALLETIGAWHVLYDLSTSSCFVKADYEDGSVVRFGSIEGRFYIMLANHSWLSLKANQTYLLRFVFEKTAMVLTATTKDSDLPTLWVADPPPTVPSLLVTESSLEVEFVGKRIGSWGLDDLRKAIIRMIICTSQVDPFQP